MSLASNLCLPLIALLALLDLRTRLDEPKPPAALPVTLSLGKMGKVNAVYEWKSNELPYTGKKPE